MQAMYAKRLLKLADFLDKLPKEKFNFGLIAEVGNKPMLEALKAGRQRCGTTACAIGWMPAVFPRQVCWVGAEKSGEILEVGFRAMTIDTYPATNFGVAEQFFGLTSEESGLLFNPGETEDSLGDEATPKQVAGTIRKFVRKAGQ